MGSYTMLELVILIFGAVTMLGEFGVVLSLRPDRQVLSLLRRFRAWAASFFPSKQSSPVEPFVVHVQRLILAQRQQAMRSAMRACCFAHIFNLAWIVWAIVMQRPRWMTDSQTVVFTLGGVATILACISPKAISAASIAIWYSCFMLMCTVFVSLEQSQGNMFLSVILAYVLRIFFSICSGCSSLLIAFWGTFHVVMAWCFFVDSASRLMGSASIVYIAFEGFTTLLLICYCAGAKSATLQNAARDVKQSMLTGEQEAMSRMLSFLCDITFELDAEFCFRETSPKLSALLALGPWSVQRGKTFSALFVDPEDRLRFEQRLADQRESGTGDAAGQVETVRLRSGIGNSIEAEVYFVRYELCTEECFLIGLRECGDTTIDPLRWFPKDRKLQKMCGALADADDAMMSDSDSLFSECSICSLEEPPTPGIRNFRRTSSKAMQFSVVHAMNSWSLPEDSAVSCCKYHVATAQLAVLLRRLQRGPCVRTFHKDFGLQCKRCGIINRSLRQQDCRDGAEWSCFVCGRKHVIGEDALPTTRPGGTDDDRPRRGHVSASL